MSFLQLKAMFTHLLVEIAFSNKESLKHMVVYEHMIVCGLVSRVSMGLQAPLVYIATWLCCSRCSPWLMSI